MLWWIASGLVIGWFVLRFIVHQKGWVHLLLIAGASIFVVQIMAYRKTKYQRDLAKK